MTKFGFLLLNRTDRELPVIKIFEKGQFRMGEYGAGRQKGAAIGDNLDSSHIRTAPTGKFRRFLV